MKATRKKVEDMYSDYSDYVKDRMCSIYLYLQKEYNEVSDQWILTLDLLASNLERLQQIRQLINEQGLVSDNGLGLEGKNQFLKNETEIQVRIEKEIAELGLSPRSAKKISPANTEENSADVLKELLA